MTDYFEVEQWVLGTPELVGESLQIAPLKLKNGNPIVATTEACFCPFDLSSRKRDCNSSESGSETLRRLREED